MSIQDLSQVWPGYLSWGGRPCVMRAPGHASRQPPTLGPFNIISSKIDLKNRKVRMSVGPHVVCLAHHPYR